MRSTRWNTRWSTPRSSSASWWRTAYDIRDGRLDDSVVLQRMQHYAQRAIGNEYQRRAQAHARPRIYITDGMAWCCSIPAGATWERITRAGTMTYLTLQGKYGARSTRAPIQTTRCLTVMHVAAPIAMVATSSAC